MYEGESSAKTEDPQKLETRTLVRGNEDKTKIDGSDDTIRVSRSVEMCSIIRPFTWRDQSNEWV